LAVTHGEVEELLGRLIFFEFVVEDIWVPEDLAPFSGGMRMLTIVFVVRVLWRN
jgi:hypothetical protein